MSVAFDAMPWEPIGPSVARTVRESLEPRRAEMVELLGDLVRIESPSDDPAGLARMAERLAALFAACGTVRARPVPAAGVTHLDVAIAGREALPHALVLCHYDTVWPAGTLATMPFAVDAAGVARGPGCFDMKGGIVLLRFALDALRAMGSGPRRPLRILFTADEEVQSATARPLIDEASRGAGVAYVLESPLPGGALKTARKGTGTYRLVVEGRAAHAGVEPEKGISAVLELAHQTVALHALNDPARGTTVNVGVARGGTRPNVVGARAEAEIDVRMTTLEEAARIRAAIEGLRPIVPGARLTVTAGLPRPPLERTDAIARLFLRAQAIAAGMGLALDEGATGGASDGNLVAWKGLATLDGLGPEGGGAHAAEEHVLTESLPRRAALLAGLLAEV